MIVGSILLVGLVWILVRAPRTKSLGEEERELRAYFKRRDDADARGEHFPQ